MSIAARPFPIEAANLCVKCGMCLPHCPTYGATRDESESPRGRIMLMQGLVTGQLQPSATLEAHLDLCLGCRACEAVCPADVPYGRLIDSARALLAQQRPARTRVARWMAAGLINRPARFLAALALWIYQRTGLQWLLRKSGLLGRGPLARLESLLPEIYLPFLPTPSPYPLPQGGEGKNAQVALFANCTSPLVEPQALSAAVKLLEALGCGVSVPAGQTCCGALHQHAGMAEPASACARKNIAAFANAPAVVGIASGCTAQLVEYGPLPDGPGADSGGTVVPPYGRGGGADPGGTVVPPYGRGDGAAFARKSADLHRFLLEHPNSSRLRFRPLPARVLLHTPCTLRNVLKGEAAVRQLLERIPELEVVPMDAGCCGAAGSYFLTQPQMADQLLEPKLAHIGRELPAYVLSSNVGCSMHLVAGLRRAGITAPVWHPARLLAQQLDG